ncbi:class I SAM-dependent methyltransferase [Embleya sp. NPDC127516]|uniref:class I SAM-dependent methyltransferase n=1 Tax=Embleya sp. NPDC127516 TaxID=3363990 RepID=UPI00381F0E88
MVTVSATALVVAGGQLLVGQDPTWRPLVGPQAQAFLRTALGGATFPWSLLAAATRWRMARGLLRGLERIFLPGLFAHQALRKQLLREWARQSISEGVEQVVVLGSGLDTLALELSGVFPGTRFIEFDRAPSLNLKRSAYERYGGLKNNHALVEGDLARGGVEDQLARSPLYVRQARTLFVVEGVLMYLEAEEVTVLLGELGARPAGTTWCAFSFMGLDVSGRPSFVDERSPVQGWLRRRDEVFRWGSTHEQLADMLTTAGFTVRAMTERDTLAGRAPDKNAKVARGEYLCLSRNS